MASVFCQYISLVCSYTSFNNYAGADRDSRRRGDNFSLSRPRPRPIPLPGAYQEPAGLPGAGGDNFSRPRPIPVPGRLLRFILTPRPLQGHVQLLQRAHTAQCRCRCVSTEQCRCVSGTIGERFQWTLDLEPGVRLSLDCWGWLLCSDVEPSAGVRVCSA